MTSFDVLTKLILEFKILFLQLSNKTNFHLKDCLLYFPQLHAGRWCFQSCLSIHSVHKGKLGSKTVLGPGPLLGLGLRLENCPGPTPGMLKIVQFGPHCARSWTHPLFNLFHYEARTLGKRVVGILLECLFVCKFFHHDAFRKLNSSCLEKKSCSSRFGF